MRVIPVMDILSGVVVHARKGERDKYQPIESVLSPSAEPVDVARAFYREFKFKELYIADLDAIQTKGNANKSIKKISEATPMKLMVDAGTNNLEAAHTVKEAGASKIIIATETLENQHTLSKIVEEMGSDRIISSLDIKLGKVLSKSPELRKLSPSRVARILEEGGASQLIVLELARVGSELGVDTALVESVVKVVGVPVITGGGVRDINDLSRLREIGVDGALVATSLHTDAITPDDLRGFLNRNRLAPKLI